MPTLDQARTLSRRPQDHVYRSAGVRFHAEGLRPDDDAAHVGNGAFRQHTGLQAGERRRSLRPDLRLIAAPLFVGKESDIEPVHHFKALNLAKGRWRYRPFTAVQRPPVRAMHHP